MQRERSDGRAAPRRGRNGRRLVAPALAAVVLLVAAAAAAQATTIRLRCAGKGPRNRDSAGTVLCAGTPAHGRTISGVIRDDAGRPVAARLTVTFSTWNPVGNSSFTVTPRTTRTIAAKADGTFSVHDNPATKESIQVQAVPDAALGVSDASAAADVSRELVVKIAKLGGGVVRFTVSGTTHRPLKVYVLDSFGYALPGVRPRNVDRRGRATFHLGTRHGTFAYYVDAGELGSLFWPLSRTPFRL